MVRDLLHFEERLGDEDELLEMLLDGVVESGPCFSATGVKAPALVAFAEKDINQDTVAAADVNEAGKDGSLFSVAISDREA